MPQEDNSSPAEPRSIQECREPMCNLAKQVIVAASKAEQQPIIDCCQIYLALLESEEPLNDCDLFSASLMLRSLTVACHPDENTVRQGDMAIAAFIEEVRLFNDLCKMLAESALGLSEEEVSTSASALCMLDREAAIDGAKQLIAMVGSEKFNRMAGDDKPCIIH